MGSQPMKAVFMESGIRRGSAESGDGWPGRSSVKKPVNGFSASGLSFSSFNPKR